MGTDFSKVRLNALLDYAGVHLKQGAVLLDSDANELMDILDRRIRALASDVLGRATVSSTTPDAFKITMAGGGLEIGIGRLYVDGLLAECHGARPAILAPADRVFDDLLGEPKFAKPVPYAAQPYQPPQQPVPTSGTHLVYLDVWDREVTHLEQPDLVEKAVGVETSAREQTVWQVRVHPSDSGSATCASPDGDLPGWANVIAPSTGVLSTGTHEVAPAADPCELPPTGGYRGLEHRLYRVEIHDPGDPGDGATFKWSGFNKSIGTRVASMVSASEVEVDSLGRDDVLSLKTNDWVEFLDDPREFAQLPGHMRRITVNAATRRITFTPPLPADMALGPFPDNTNPEARNLRLRRWERGKIFEVGPGGPILFKDLDVGSSGVIKVPEAGTTLILENGVTVSFDSTGDTGFRAGDYWVFAASPVDASVEILDRAPPRGIHHHYARLGIWDVAAGTVTDCRNPWPPKGGDDCSCTACVTAESHLTGAFTIQDAVDRVKPTGGTVCLGPGQYQLDAPVRIDGATSLRIRGQGLASLIVATAGAFEIKESLLTAVENLGILSVAGPAAISVDTAIGLSLTRLVVATLGADRGSGVAISLQGAVAAATIAENVIFAETGIFANALGTPGAVNLAPTGDFSVLFVAALKIDDNIFLCDQRGVVLDGNVLYFLGNRITGNEFLGCHDFGASALGFGLEASSMTISRNDFSVAGGVGIRCGAEGVWIDNNKIVNTESQLGTTSAILVTAGADQGGMEQCHILANQISGFGGTGIYVSTPVRALIVKQNIIEKCGQGIWSFPNTKAGKLSIENNQLLGVGPPESPFAIVVGILVLRAGSATIAGNTIRSLGVQPAGMSFCTGIYTWDVDRARILGNEMTDIGPSVFEGNVGGIVLASPLGEFEVHHNRVERETIPAQGSGGNWTALQIGPQAAQGAIAPGAAAPTGTAAAAAAATGTAAATRSPAATTNLNSTRIGNVEMVALDGRRILAAAPILGSSGSILGNVIRARGQRPAVEVTAGECLFNDNRVEIAGFTTAVALSAPVAIVSANRVKGARISIAVTTAASRPAAVVGNITTGIITVSGGFTAPFAPLNLIA